MPKPELEFFPVDRLPWIPVEGAHRVTIKKSSRKTPKRCS